MGKEYEASIHLAINKLQTWPKVPTDYASMVLYIALPHCYLAD